MLHRICRLGATLIIFLLATGCTARSVQPELVNIQQARAAVETYHANGQYLHDIKIIVNDLRKHIEETLASGKYTKPAIVFDIDETLLSNYQAEKEMGFNFRPRYWRHWVNLSKAPAIEPVRTLYGYAVSKKLTVFIITGRKASVRQQTIKNLKQEGYTQWTRLFFREKFDEKKSAQQYKTAVRKQLSEQDEYQIIANVGDQESDLDGGYAVRTFKLPNYMYIIH
ncbi:HAD family acid phosphatase [uncultured Pseudodesulfovibrio sp.]|uniref:HAD family acid phosphatase n=1 Tax=uncultured Pseudodesulfovibrio sp. TaxID=2035858 RepID=UPI0029C791C4|nr:HAD family acid phosphatase [uncultured Pseudodesulfovibrio sp.]